MRPRILIFDLDGTLVDTMGPAADLFCEMLLEEYGITAEECRPVFTRLMGKGPRAQFEEVLAYHEPFDEAKLADLTARYWKRDEAHVPALFPDVLEVLEDLGRNGHMLFVSSGSTPASVDRKLRITDIQHLFRLALGSDLKEGGMAKGPGHFARFTGALGITHRDLQTDGVFIGDGVYDMQIAREAGLMGIGRLTGDNADGLTAAGASAVIRDLSELELAIEQ